MNSLPHDLMNESIVDDDNGSDNNLPVGRGLSKAMVAIVMVATVILTGVFSALISWIVVDIKSSRQSPMGERIQALEAQMAVNVTSLDTQKVKVADLSSNLNNLDNSIAYFRNTYSEEKIGQIDKLTEQTKELILRIEAIKLQLNTMRNTEKSSVKVVNKKTVVAPVRPVVNNTSTRVYSIRTQGEKQWVTLIDGGRISRSLSVGDAWNNVKIKQIEDTRVVVEVNNKSITLFI